MRLQRAPRGKDADKNDDRSLRHNRARHEGFRVGWYVQPPPMFFSADAHNLWIGDTYRGRSAFLICGGPSFAKLDHSKLRQPGIITLGVNNSPKTFRPNLWCSVDSPHNFIRSIWLDPQVQKFVPLDHTEKKLFDSDSWKQMDVKVRDCPNVVYFRRNEHFQAKQWLTESSFNWGDVGKPKQKDIDSGKAKLDPNRMYGGRSVMLPALRILFLLGFRRVYLLGCDFKMDEQNKYHFDQDRAAGSIGGNNDTYQRLGERFKMLRPLFEREGFHIFNCNPDSNLKAFDHVPFDKAVAEVVKEFGVDTKNERTEGLYDREAKEREAKKLAKVAAKKAEKLAKKARGAA